MRGTCSAVGFVASLDRPLLQVTCRGTSILHVFIHSLHVFDMCTLLQVMCRAVCLHSGCSNRLTQGLLAPRARLAGSLFTLQDRSILRQVHWLVLGMD